MPSPDLFLTFLATTAVFAFIPGPAMLFAAAQTVARGRRSGAIAALGIHLGGYAHVIAAAAGLSVLFHAVPVLYATVKLVGAAYLIWLGFSMVRGKDRDLAVLTGADLKSGRRTFVESVSVEVLNPKTALFFLAFLPQFTDASANLPVSLQLVILGGIVNLMFSAADLVCVMVAGALVSRLGRSGRVQRLMRRTGGSVLIGLGAHLALQRS